MEERWPEVLSSIERRVSQKNFNTWFKPLKFIESDDDTVYLGVRDRFTRDWLNDHGLKDIAQQEFSAVTSREIRVVLRILDRSETRVPSHPATMVESSTPEEKIEEASREAGLNPSWRFEDFVVGPSNQLAYAACMNVAENPGTTYNPLFIYGGSGLGKTHLLNAIGHKILELNPRAGVIYTYTETFVNEMINSIRHMTMDKFRDKYRSRCDALLIDDIHFLSNKTRTQEEFFHTFNTLHESRRQIVITSDTYPKEIPDIEERLRTRFEWGLIADIQPPEIETRIAILQMKAEREGLDIPDDVASFVASSVKSNVREIEGSVKRLAAFSSMYGKPVTIEFAKDVLKETLGKKKKLNVDDVLKAVAGFFNVKISDIKGSRRHRSVSRPRQIAMYICRTNLNATYPEIGNQFNKDHSTAISAVSTVEKIMKIDSSVREAVEAIKRQLGL
jgi:chromosomal replication initiator protein